MAFFPRNFYSPESSFTPLFRLLDDFDNYSRQGTSEQQQHGRRSGLQSWQPKFDVRETGDDYELHGELAGMDKDQVHIEFSDPQTMLIRGRVERNYSAGTPPAGFVEGASSSRRAIADGEAKQAHRATVEDADEGAASAEGAQSKTDSDVVLAESDKSENRKPADNAKYWLTERSIGEFSRSFSFPTRIDQDGVTASFKNGILSITVPKAKKHESRRIAIS